MWFPPGDWTDYFTGQTYTGPTVADVTTDWNSMPVFVKAGGIVPERSANVTNDMQNPLDAVTLDVASGGGRARTRCTRTPVTGTAGSASTAVGYAETSAARTLTIGGMRGHFAGQVGSRRVDRPFPRVAAPAEVRVDGRTIGQASDGRRLGLRSGHAHAQRPAAGSAAAGAHDVTVAEETAAG